MKEDNKFWVRLVLALVVLGGCVALMFCTGCATSPAVGVKGKGVYTNVNTGTVGAGYFKVTTTPQGTDSAYVEYSEDTALLAPSTKTHYIEANLSGSNAVSQVGLIVKSICDAYISYRSPATNTVNTAGR